MSYTQFTSKVHSQSSVNLIYAVPVTFESLELGITQHAYWFPRMKALRDALKRRSVPEEVLRMIEKERRYGTRVVGLDALSLAVLSFYTIGWTRRQARLQQIRDGLQDLGVNLLSLGRISEIEYMKRIFGLSLFIGCAERTRNSYPPRFKDLTPVYICLPWHVAKCSTSQASENEKVVTAQNRFGSLEIDDFRHELFADNRLRSRATIVDPEYLNLTLEKRLKVNRAIKDLNLTVVGADQTQHNVGEMCRMTSNRDGTQGTATESRKDDSTSLAHERDSVNVDSHPWPQSNDGRLWLPQLILNHQDEMDIRREKFEQKVYEAKDDDSETDNSGDNDLAEMRRLKDAMLDQ